MDRPVITDRLRAERDMYKTVGSGCWVLPEFVLRYGTVCVPQQLPKRYRMRMPKACFWNAQDLVKKSKVLRYVEGYTCRPAMPILIPHGWCVDRENRVIDPTLADYKTGESDSHTSEYIGVIFEPELYKALRPRGGGSFFDSGFGYRTDLFVSYDPAFQSVVDEALATKPHPALQLMKETWDNVAAEDRTQEDVAR